MNTDLIEIIQQIRKSLDDLEQRIITSSNEQAKDVVCKECGKILAEGYDECWFCFTPVG